MKKTKPMPKPSPEPAIPWEKSPGKKQYTFGELKKISLDEFKEIALAYEVIQEETEEEHAVSLDGCPTLTKLRELLDEAEKDYGIDPDKCSVSVNYNNTEILFSYSFPYDLGGEPPYTVDQIRGKVIEKQKAWEERYRDYLAMKKEFGDV